MQTVEGEGRRTSSADQRRKKVIRAGEFIFRTGLGCSRSPGVPGATVVKKKRLRRLAHLRNGGGAWDISIAMPYERGGQSSAGRKDTREKDFGGERDSTPTSLNLGGYEKECISRSKIHLGGGPNWKRWGIIKKIPVTK